MRAPETEAIIRMTIFSLMLAAIVTTIHDFGAEALVLPSVHKMMASEAMTSLVKCWGVQESVSVCSSMHPCE
jgi:hypothetical protein